jgi:signal transduction histidine kinase
MPFVKGASGNLLLEPMSVNHFSLKHELSTQDDGEPQIWLVSSPHWDLFSVPTLTRRHIVLQSHQPILLSIKEGHSAVTEDEMWIRQESNQMAVVLIHGIGAASPKEYWSQFIKVLLSDTNSFVKDFDLYLWGYPTHRLPSLLKNIQSAITYKTLHEAAPAIEDLADTWDITYQERFRNFQNIVLICHSMGGLIVKSWIVKVLGSGQSPILDKLRHITFYGTPHEGSPIIKLSLGNNQLRDMKPDSKFILDLDKNWYDHVVIYKYKNPEPLQILYNRFIPHLVISGLNDIIVPKNFSSITGMDTKRIKGDHSQIIQPRETEDLSYKIWHHNLEEVLLPERTQTVISSNQISDRSGTEKNIIFGGPYRGLLAFQEEDEPFFFGREILTKQLVGEARKKPFVALIGPSGCGKSSIVFAGLIPKLRKEGFLIASFRPQDRPFHSLAAALLPFLQGQMSEVDMLIEINKLTDRLREGNVALLDVIELLVRKHDVNHFLLVADQFEELYTLCPQETERRKFLDRLIAAIQISSKLRRKANFTLVITLRTDFLDHTLLYRPFADVLQHADIKLGPMNRLELRHVIEKPAQLLGLKIEAGLTDRILDAISQEPGQLPLLEFALTQLWMVRRGWKLTHTAYDEIGGVERALAIYAEKSYLELSEEEQKQAERIFLQLVQLGEGTENIRRRARRRDISEGDWSLVPHLANARLVVTGQDNTIGENTVEIAHEALIRVWQRLKGWMEADREFRIWQERLRHALHEWEKNGKDTWSLLRGPFLTESEGWSRQRSENIGPAEQAFIQASRDQRTAELKRSHEFIISVRHDLRTPLVSIKAAIYGLLQPGFDWDGLTYREILEDIDTNADLLNSVINKVVELSGFEMGAVVLKKDRCDVVKLVHETIVPMGSVLAGRKIRTYFQPDLPLVRVDAFQLERVFRNLLDNAVKYSPEQAEILITLEIKSGMLRAQVIDQGNGVSSAARESIFKPYYLKEGGGGFSLVICRGIIEAHGGHIWVEPILIGETETVKNMQVDASFPNIDGDSRDGMHGKQKGSCFVFMLPLDEE